MKWNLEDRQTKELHDYDKNPRDITKEQASQLQESIDKFGLCEPIVINQDNEIIGGHQRVRIMQKLKKKYVEVYVPDRMLSANEVEELNLRLNKNVGVWDYDVLANSWDQSDILDWGFSEKELGIDIEYEEKEIEEKFTCPTCGKKRKKDFVNSERA